MLITLKVNCLVCQPRPLICLLFTSSARLINAYFPHVHTPVNGAAYNSRNTSCLFPLQCSIHTTLARKPLHWSMCQCKLFLSFMAQTKTASRNPVSWIWGGILTTLFCSYTPSKLRLQQLWYLNTPTVLSLYRVSYFIHLCPDNI